MIFNTKPTQKNACQKLTDISLNKDKSNELWSELDETSQAALSGGITGATTSGFEVSNGQPSTSITNSTFAGNRAGSVGGLEAVVHPVRER
jgi:hypothetical protein